MTTDIASAELDTTLEEVAQMMKDEDVGAIPVVDEDELVGIVTDRDIVIRCIAEGKDPAETHVEDVLTEELHTIHPDADAAEAARLMAEKQIRRLPVVEDGELLGVISIGDIAVKQSDDQITGEALQEVSQGVKQQGRSQGSVSSSARRSSQSTKEEGGKQRSRSKQSSGGRVQAISNRSSHEGRGRQAKVAPGRVRGRSTGKRRAS
jgi:predicted transcriptional regulator